MIHFLVVFDRKAEHVEHMKAFANGKDALRARFAYERDHDLSPNIEVVVLVSESKQALLRTHARYFNRVKDLLETALSRQDITPKKQRSGLRRLVGRTV